MRILQVIDFMPETSGGARFVVDLVIQLKKKNFEVDVLLIDGRRSHFISELEKHNINIICLDYDVNRYNPKYIFKISFYLKKYDIVHVHIFPTSYLVALSRYFFKSNAKFIFTEHNSFNRRAQNLLFSYFETFMYSQFDMIVSINNRLVDFLNNTNVKIKQKKIKVIENGVNLKKLKNIQPSNRDDFSLLNSDIVIVMAARFAPQKDHKTLIRAVALLSKQYKLILCGDGVLLGEMKKFSLELGLDDTRVKFLGSRSDVLNIIKMSDINVLSSHYEGFGLSIVEAMALGKPVIGTKVEGLSDVLKDAGLAFEVGDVQTLATHIMKIGQDSQYAHRLCILSLEKSKLYDIESMTDKYLSVYSHLMEE